MWAFGAALYEMVTGREAFEGKTHASLLGAILASEPARMELTPITPAWLERLVRRCLAKDPEDRWQSMRDIVLELRSPPEESGSATPAIAVAPANRRSALPWILVLAALFAGAALALVLLLTPENGLATYNFKSYARQEHRLRTECPWNPSGLYQTIAFVRRNKVYPGSLEGGGPREFPIEFGGRNPPHRDSWWPRGTRRSDATSPANSRYDEVFHEPTCKVNVYVAEAATMLTMITSRSR